LARAADFTGSREKELVQSLAVLLLLRKKLETIGKSPAKR
jgi:hypothetical protein